ncbi:Beta-phosphoglucomutase [compost metagenome]
MIVSGFEVEKSKPFPDVFLRAAEQLGVPTSECVVIEDSTHGISAAKAANIFCIGYQNPMGKQNLSQADRIIEDFSELLKSDFIYGNKY